MKSNLGIMIKADELLTRLDGVSISWPPSVNVGLKIEQPVATRDGIDPKDKRPFVQSSTKKLLQWYPKYQSGTFSAMGGLPYVDVKPLRGNAAGFSNGVDLSKVKITIIPDQWPFPPRLVHHKEAAVELFKRMGRLNKLATGEYENNTSARIRKADWDNLEIEVQKASYFDQLGTNLTLDWASGKIQKGSARTIRPTIRNAFELPVEGALVELSRSNLANTVGVATILITSDDFMFLRVRSSKVAVMSGEFKLHCSASGVFKWDHIEALHGESAFRIFTEGVIDEIRTEINIGSSDIKEIIPLAFARELVRGGKPQLFFLVMTELSYSDIRERSNRAEEKWEFIEIDSMAKDNNLRQIAEKISGILGIPGQITVDNAKELITQRWEKIERYFTYEGAANLLIAVRYLRGESLR